MSRAQPFDREAPEKAVAADQRLMLDDPVWKYAESPEEERHYSLEVSGMPQHHVCLLTLSPTRCD